MDSSLILEIINRYGMIAVFISISLEYACFPIPSEVVLPFAGAYAAGLGIPFIFILLISVAAGLFGCLCCYLIGYFGGGAIVDSLERRHKKLAGGLDASRKWFDKYGGVSVMIGRALPLFRTYISFIAGISKQNLLKFLGYSMVGITVWNVVLVGLGYKLAEHWNIISLYAKRYTYILLPLVLLIIFIVFCQIKRRKEKVASERRLLKF